LCGVPDPLPFDPIAEARRQWQQHWGPAATPAMAAVTSIIRAQQIFTGRMNTLLKPWGLTYPRYEALMLLAYSRSGSLPLGKMGARLQIHPTSVTNTIDGLERLGLVTRTRHERDRRTTLATITSEGRAVATASTEVLNRERFGTSPLTDADLEAIFTILRTAREGAEDFDEDGGQREG
jgi:DNA-binding MarR family transcriptional regulator